MFYQTGREGLPRTARLIRASSLRDAAHFSRLFRQHFGYPPSRRTVALADRAALGSAAMPIAQFTMF
jgi:AraC-like DNA-binding protein